MEWVLMLYTRTKEIRKKKNDRVQRLRGNSLGYCSSILQYWGDIFWYSEGINFPADASSDSIKKYQPSRYQAERSLRSFRLRE